MSENIITQTIENKIVTTDDLQDTSVYIPSSVEKKRAVMMYMLFGVIISISNKKVNGFEYFHLKQSIGWRLCFILVLIASVVLIFLPGIKYVGILALIAMVTFFIIFVKQAWDGKYHTDSKKYIFWLFPWLGGRVVDLFDIAPIQSNTKNPEPPIQDTK